MIDTWHGSPEVFDDNLDAQIHRWYADILSDRRRKVWPPRNIPYFSPSSANDCRRGLYERLRGAKCDQRQVQPHQGRWTRLGTTIGDVIQRDLLFIEKHYEKVVGESPRFTIERNQYGEPLFEDFAKTAHAVLHNGKHFALYGTCDGIMEYKLDEGEIIRVGLEIKSKQTTSAQTTPYSMREPSADHVKQVVSYSIMYGVDHYIILYVNASKKAWNMGEEEYAKNPDIRAFHIYVTERDRQALLDEFADVMQAVEDGNPPPLDIEKWAFNKYKSACAASLTEEEFGVLRNQAKQVLKSSMPEWKKRMYAEVIEEIEQLRKGAV